MSQTILKAFLMRLAMTPMDIPVEQQQQIASSEIVRLDDLWKRATGEDLRKKTQRLAVDITEAKKVEQVMVNWLNNKRKELEATVERVDEKKTETVEVSERKGVATCHE